MSLAYRSLELGESLPAKLKFKLITLIHPSFPLRTNLQFSENKECKKKFFHAGSICETRNLKALRLYRGIFKWPYCN